MGFSPKDGESLSIAWQKLKYGKPENCPGLASHDFSAKAGW
jgi:hypothetical protein